ncbi:Scm-like with four MBT domains protein 2, partial [Stegodyphus mimosarum]
MEISTKGTPVQDGLDPDFIWQEYLEETKSVAAPPIAFTHVEYSLESSFKVGMKLEILNSEDKNYYWLATVVMICGELLSLRYAGYGDDRSADFWFDIKSGGFYPVGWCAANNKKLRPPKGVLEKQQDIDSLLHEVLNNVESIPASLTEDLDAGFMPIDQIKCGMKVEIAEELNPQNVWIATILQNIGGRLLLRYDGCKDSSSDMWLFYLSDRLYPVGYAQENNLQYSAPEAFKEVLSDEEWKMILKQSLQEAAVLPFPSHVLEPKLPLEKHGFKKGMKLEAVNPKNCTDICPATISRVVNDYYFLVTIDAHQCEEHKKSMICCHSNSHTIFPVKWAEENGLDLKVPKGYEVTNSKFSWDPYLKFCNANPAPSELFAMSSMNMGFETGMKLEAADPLSPDNIRVATVERILDPLMWIRFDSEESDVRIVITSINSFDIYPVGWCATNGYLLQTPCFRKTKPKYTLNELSEEGKTKSSQSDAGTASHIEVARTLSC